MISADNIEEFIGSKAQHVAWIEEAIWGHRLERQPFSALTLEFLGMAEGMFRQGKLLATTRPSESAEYTPNRSLQLRNLLFNNPRIEDILENSHGSDAEAWDTWLPEMKATAALGDHTADFSYLRDRFDTFGDLVNVIQLLRRITMDTGERAWTMQFLFPIGPAGLYEALYEKGAGFERTHRVFTRTGEIAYLMLSRTSEPLRTRIREELARSFDAETSRNKLILRLISSPEPDRSSAKGGSYLPYIKYPAYDRMAEDVAAILSLDLPDQDAFQYLQPLLGFHLYLYGLEVANNWVGHDGLPPIICEILAPRSDLVRQAAATSYLQNDALGPAAVRKFVDKVAMSDAELQQKLADSSLDEQAKKDYLVEHLVRTCAVKRDNPVFDASDAKTVIQDFYAFAERLYRDGTADGLAALATGCGLLSKRHTNRYRYAPTDDLLRALVLANVTEPLEESAFLRQLYERYRIAIGPVEAKTEVSSYRFEESDFKKNRDRLAQHLIGMGLAHRMSDSCTYVINPMEARQ